MSSALPAVQPDGPPHSFARGSIGRKLLIRVLFIVTLATTTVAAASIVVTQQLLLSSLDGQLSTFASERSQLSGPAAGRPQDRDFRGQPLGTILIEPAPDGASNLWVIMKSDDQLDTGNQEAWATVREELLSLPPDGQARSIALSIGDYRAIALPAMGGIVVVAQPLDRINDTVWQLMLIGIAVCTLAIVAAAVVVREVMLRSLRPLNRLAGTARQVSTQELAHGDVDLSARVSPGDADPSTEVGQVGYAFNHMLDNVAGALAARQASETKVRQFVADASHELRNPLAAIRGYSELTRRGRDTLPPQTQHAMSRIESESERMSMLVEDLLLLARLDADQRLQLEPVDASELVINAVSDAQIAGPDHRWSVDLPEQPVRVLADRYRLHQVVANLLANARTHTPPETRVATILSVRPDWAVITVCDDGPGIPEEIRDRAFERFTRADASRTRTGQGQSTGLGLAIVSAVIAAHGGDATIDSRPGRTAVRLRVRLSDAVSEDQLTEGPVTEDPVAKDQVTEDPPSPGRGSRELPT